VIKNLRPLAYNQIMKTKTRLSIRTNQTSSSSKTAKTFLTTRYHWRKLRLKCWDWTNMITRLILVPSRGRKSSISEMLPVLHLAQVVPHIMKWLWSRTESSRKSGLITLSFHARKSLTS
jgi:hypothetical protein